MPFLGLSLYVPKSTSQETDTKSQTGRKGPESIAALLKEAGPRVKSAALDESSTLRAPTATVFDADGKVHGVQAFLTLDTDSKQNVKDHYATNTKT